MVTASDHKDKALPSIHRSWTYRHVCLAQPVACSWWPCVSLITKQNISLQFPFGHLPVWRINYCTPLQVIIKRSQRSGRGTVTWPLMEWQRRQNRDWELLWRPKHQQSRNHRYSVCPSSSDITVVKEDSGGEYILRVYWTSCVIYYNTSCILCNSWTY